MKIGRLLFLSLLLAFLVSWVSPLEYGVAFVVAIGLIVVWTFARHFFKELRRSKFSSLSLFKVPLTSELSPAISLAIEKAPVLMGPKDYSRRVVWEEKFLNNWLIFAERVQAKEVETLYYVADLVIDPALAGERKAVAVCVGGYIMGYVPRVESAEIYDFLVKHGGIGRCNAQLKVNQKTKEFEAKYSLAHPFQIMEA
jgi:hypothetical protein